VINSGGPATMATSITNSLFSLQGVNTFGVWAQDVDAGSIVSNRFNGNGAAGTVLWGDLSDVSGWGIQANKGLNAFAGDPDVFFNESTSDNFLGAHAGATVEDHGCNLIQDFPGGGCAIAGPSIVKGVQSEEVFNPIVETQKLNHFHSAGQKIANHQRMLRDHINVRNGFKSNNGSH